jgi:SulP family sulfate permease
MTHTANQRFSHWLRDGFRPESLLPGLIAGLLMGVSEVIFALSVGSLIFSGELGPYLSYGIGVALVTAAIVLIGISLSSSVPGVTGSLQDSTSVIMAVMASALVGALAAASLEDRLITVLAAIAITTLLTGVFLLALGFFKLGELVRFIPYPVVGGFLAGTGWLLVRGSFGVMADFPLTLANIPALLQPGQLMLWVPGVVIALALCFGLRYVKHILVMPGILIGAIAIFYLVLLATGMPIDEAMDRGLLLGDVSAGATWHPLVRQNLPAVNWAAILGQSGNIAIILVLSAVSLLLNATGIELAVGQDIDLNRELRAAGVANILSGLGGGIVGFHVLGPSVLSHRVGARSRLPGLVAGSICAVMLFVGAPLLVFFPRPLLGGMLLFLGLDFLVEWVVDGWSRLSRADYAVVILILVVIGATDFLIGVGVGLVAMCLLFVLTYRQINVVHHALSGAEMRSNVERPPRHQRALAELGEHTYILELQGFIFFGTASTLLERIRARVADVERLPVRYIVLDFRRVTGLDSSAALSFLKCKQLAETHDITMVLTHVSAQITRQLELSGLLEDGERVRIFPDLDRGLEWCEGQLLQAERVTVVLMPGTLRGQLADNGFDKANAARLMDFLEQVNLEQDEYLFRQGDPADDLYFIEQGAVSIYMEIEDGSRVRLRTLGRGTVVGEMGLYVGTTRTASVIADFPTTAYRLTLTALSEMREADPVLAADFHEFIARMVSERLVNTNRWLEAVIR